MSDRDGKDERGLGFTCRTLPIVGGGATAAGIAPLRPSSRTGLGARVVAEALTIAAERGRA